jgi:glycosyltransferase involved in cell wall biosynthesis
LVTAGFHTRGGQSKANLALAGYLLGRGHPVHLVGHDIDPGLRCRPGVTAHVVARPAGSDLMGWIPLGWRGRRVAREVTARHPGARVVVNGGCCTWPDLNWVHCVHHAWGLLDAGAPPWFRLKNRLTKCWARHRERRALRAARLVVANSAQTRDHLIRHLGIDPTRAHVVHLGADPGWAGATEAERQAERAQLGVAPGRPVVLFAGALSYDHNKGLDTLLAAWRELARLPDWDAELLIAGDGSAVGLWKRHVAEAGLAGRVRFLGFTCELIRILAAVDLLVSPVRYEAYGLTVQEAVCRGVPTLVSARAGVVERFPPDLDEMVLPDPEDWGDLAERLRCWRADPAVWRERFRPLADRMRHSSWEQMAARIVSLGEDRPCPEGPQAARAVTGPASPATTSNLIQEPVP